MHGHGPELSPSSTHNTEQAMPATYNILIMGAAYGSLLASKMLFGGHKIHHVCLPAEADLINAEGFRVSLPVKGRKDLVELDSRKLPGKVTAGGAAGVNPKDYDLIGLAMQEPQYRSPGVRELLDAVRSEEHTSELQSPVHLVCRLLLEKKKVHKL